MNTPNQNFFLLLISIDGQVGLEIPELLTYVIYFRSFKLFQNCQNDHGEEFPACDHLQL